MSAVFNASVQTKIWSLPGGIHPDEHKAESNQTAIEPMPLPKKLWLPLKMHIGEPAKPLVSVGQAVLKGECIAQAQGFISGNIHAPTSGTVVAIEEAPYAHDSGFKSLCIVLESDGHDQWRQREPWPQWQQQERSVLVERLRSSGLAGLGGAGFPTDVKYRSTNKTINTLLINAAECEPYITADDRLIRERSEGLLIGAQIAQHLVRASRILVGIEDNKPEAIEALKQAAEKLSLPIQIAIVPTKYPSGGEKQLIQLTTGLEVPHKGLPSDVGIVCQNVGTLYQMYRSIVFDEPFISRITTVTGKSIKRPGNYEVLLGTPIVSLLEYAHYQAKKADRVIMGGPMMGFRVPDLNAGIVKTTNCLLAPTKKELPPALPDNPCIRCGMCEQACPVNLLPQQMLWAAKNQNSDASELHSLSDCIECGACAFVCPSRIPLVQYFRHAKGEMRQEASDTLASDRARARFESRQARLEREKQEKEERRKARAAAAAKALAEKQAKASNAEDSDSANEKIKAALKRSAAKKQTTITPNAAPDIETLKTLMNNAKVKFEKAQSKLTDAQQNQPEMVEALTKACDKLKEKYLSAEKNLAQALQNENMSTVATETLLQPSASDESELATLKITIDKTHAQLIKAQQKLSNAEQNDPNKVAPLTQARDKLQSKLATLEASYQKAHENTKAPGPSQSPKPTDPQTLTSQEKTPS